MDLTAPNPHYDPCPYEAEERAHERARAEVISYLEGGYCDIEELIPMLDGDGIALLCRVLLTAYREGVASKWYSDAEQLVDALACAETDRAEVTA